MIAPADLLTNFGRAVRDLRVARQLSQEQLADRAQTSQNYISAIELGKRNPSLVTIANIATALDTTPSALLGSAMIRRPPR